MPFLSVSRAALCYLSKRSSPALIIQADKFSKLYFSTSGSQNATEKKYKRPLNPFQRFQVSLAAQIKSERSEDSPKMNKGEFPALSSEKWSQADPSIKERYQMLFEKEMEEFNAPFKKLPRKPASAFGTFVKEKFPVFKEQGNLSSQETFKKVSEEWNITSDEKRKIFEQKYDEAYKKYIFDVITFKDNLSEEEIDFLNHFDKDKMAKLEQKRLKLLNYPRKPLNAFLVFVKMEKEKFPRGDNESILNYSKRMAEQWKNMSDDEKQIYVDESKKCFEKYTEAVKKWELENNPK